MVLNLLTLSFQVETFLLAVTKPVYSAETLFLAITKPVSSETFLLVVTDPVYSAETHFLAITKPVSSEDRILPVTKATLSDTPLRLHRPGEQAAEQCLVYLIMSVC